MLIADRLFEAAAALQEVLQRGAFEPEVVVRDARALAGVAAAAERPSDIAVLVAVIPPRRGAFLAVSNWTKDVTAAEVTELVQAFVDKALAAQEGRPSPGDAISAG